ncbi:MULTISPECIES: hypothetical protein [unclassified Streptomyces]|uniref:hypothetical protein n=1 Tax=unclassified Streptomyces TaxID=2593676 RepID=UPI00037906E1|nr:MULTISPECIES: hypothetical protein [unclassified Streptomyces]MYT28292.1 hypothetical protein [Streptomyces sp. SID8354]
MRGKNIPLQRGAARLASLALSLGAATTLLSTAFCGQAQAADGPSDIPDYQSARQVLRTPQVHDTVSRFLGATANAGADGGMGAAAPMTPEPHNDQQAFSLQDPVPLYELAPGFITGKEKPTAGNAVHLSHLASLADNADGHKATVLLSAAAKGGGKSGGGWHLAGVRDGDGDITYGRQSTGGSTVFTEPQIHAWYRLKNNTVEPLNRDATSGLHGKRSVTLAAYQKLVHSRYADKQPGSTYDRKGLAGGYGLASKATSSSLDPTQLVSWGVTAVVLAAGAVAAWRCIRRRSQAS